MLTQAHTEAPKECCGVLLGTGDVVAEVVSVRNAAQDPEFDKDPTKLYRMDAKEQYRAQRMSEERGWEIIGIYHSHPKSRAYPSATDQALAVWLEPRYVIISLADPERPDVRAFRITERIDGNGTPVRDSEGKTVKDVTEEDVVVS